MLLSGSDYDIIQLAMSGRRLPYSSFTDEECRKLLAYKRNNTAALVICSDGFNDYMEDDELDLSGETVSEFKDEIANFCIYGLLSIGYFGISVENGMPKRIDSCGHNIGKHYSSVYETMTPEEYEMKDRINSMLIDQRDNRRFLKYLRALKRSRAESFVPALEEYNRCAGRKIAEKCLGADEMFLKVLMKLGRASGGSQQYMNATDIDRMIKSIRSIVAPYRDLLKDDDVVNLTSYTTTDMKPIRF